MVICAYLGKDAGKNTNCTCCMYLTNINIFTLEGPILTCMYFSQLLSYLYQAIYIVYDSFS